MSEDERFPRGKTLPYQSPLFWVAQKDRYLRQLLIRDIQEITSRRLVVYFANRFENAVIDSRDVLYMTELLSDVDDDPLDLLLETNGGQTDATEALVSLIRTRISNFRVIVANAAKSNGTLLCLAAHEIVMGCASELGPIEPLVNNIPCSILTQPEIKQQNFALNQFGHYALAQTRKLATTLLEEGMMHGRPSAEIEKTVQQLCSRDSYFSHGSVIDYREASALGLKVQYLPPDDDLWGRVWLLHCMYEHDCRRARYLKVFEGIKISTAISVPASPAQPVPTR